MVKKTIILKIKSDIFIIDYSIEADENLVESEYEDDEEINVTQKNEPETKISWLLQNALENLGVTVSSYVVSPA